MLVYYSLGNFLSGQNGKDQIEKGTNIGGIANFDIVMKEDGSIEVDNVSLIEFSR